MRRINQLQSLCPKSCHKLFGSLLSTYQILQLSSLSRSSNLSHFNKTKNPNVKDPAETNSFSSLFKEITEVLGAEDVIPDKTPSGFSITKEADTRIEEFGEKFKLRTIGVCGNATLNVELQDKVILGETQNGHLNRIDVSPAVHEITGIVRAEKDAVPLEDRLETVEFPFEPEIVEKVLKRCFKVPHLAFRFFTWVKMKDGFCHTSKIYNTMLYIAGEAKEFTVVDNLLDEMEKNKVEKDVKTWTILILQYGKAKLIGKALFFFEKMRKSGCEPDEEAYKMMIHSLCNAGKDDIALEFYKEMVQRGMGLGLSLYKVLLNCLAKSGDVAAVSFVADEMRRLYQIPERDVHLCVLKCFCVGGRIREALEFIRDINNKGMPLDCEHFETLVKGLCKADRIADALEIFEIMKRKHVVDGKIYGIIIHGFLRIKELSKALNLFQNIKECGHLPGTSTYTELMQHLFRSNEYQKGCELYKEMLGKGIEMDSVAIMAVVAGHVRQNHILKAWEVFETMEDKGIKPTWKSYSIFIKELCKVSRTDEIFKVLEKMMDSKIFIHDEVFKWVISCMEKKGEVENVKKARQMQRMCGFHSPDPEVFSNDILREKEAHAESNHNRSEQGRVDRHLVKPLSKAYNEEDLQEICRILSCSEDWGVIQEALEKCPVHFTPDLVVEILRNCGTDGKAALHFFSWVGTQTSYRHTTETYNMAMKISGRGKDFRHMRNLFYEMRRKGGLVTPDTWAIMIMQYGRTGLTEIALKIFNEMKANAYNPTYSTYKYLIICLCGKKGRKIDEAIKIFHEMISAGHIPDKELIETYFCFLCELGLLSEARRCIDRVCKIGFTTPLIYSLYIRALCRAGRLEEALSLVDEVKEERSTLDRYTNGSLIHGLLRKGRVEEALAKVDSMKQTGIHPSVHVYTSLIVHFFKERQTEKALGILNKMQKEGCEPTIVTYSALIRGYMNTGKVADAWNVFHDLKLKGPTPDFKTYSMFISCLCRAKRSEGALELVSEMLDNGIVPSTVNFRTVFYGLNREGKQELAQTVLHKKWALISKRKFLT